MATEITTQDAQYAWDIVKKICTEVGPGLPGSSQERERAAFIKREFTTGHFLVRDQTYWESDARDSRDTPTGASPTETG